MPLPYPEGTAPREADSPQRALVKINQLVGDLTDALETGGGGSGDVLTDLQALTADEVDQAQAALGNYKYDSYSLRGPIRSGNVVTPPRDSTIVMDGVVDSKYYGFPGAIRLRNGDLVVVARKGEEHEGVDGGNFVLSRSTDLGRTWSAPEEVWAIPESPVRMDGRDVMLSRLADGRIAMSVYWLDPYPDTPPWDGSNTYTTGQVRYGTEDENGVITWSDPVTIVARGKYNTTAAPVLHGKLVQLANGDILASAYTTGGALVILASTDNGATWSQRNVRLSAGGGEVFSEEQLVQLPSGKVIGMIRQSAGTGDPDTGYWYRESEDNGETWTEPVQKINTYGGAGRPEFCRLDCGALVMVTRCGVGATTGAGAYIYTSWDDGATWVQNDVQLSTSSDAAGSVGTMMYAALVPLSPNEVGVACGFEIGTESSILWKSIGFPPFVGPGGMAATEANLTRIATNQLSASATSDADFYGVRSLNYLGTINAELGHIRSSAGVYLGRLRLSRTGTNAGTITFTNKGGQIEIAGAGTALTFFSDYQSCTVGFYHEATVGCGINVSSGRTFRAYIAGTMTFGANATGWAIPAALHTPPASASATGTAGEIRFGSDGYLYLCTAANTWVRVQLTTWS